MSAMRRFANLRPDGSSRPTADSGDWRRQRLLLGVAAAGDMMRMNRRLRCEGALSANSNSASSHPVPAPTCDSCRSTMRRIAQTPSRPSVEHPIAPKRRRAVAGGPNSSLGAAPALLVKDRGFRAGARRKRLATKCSSTHWKRWLKILILPRP